MGFLVVSEMCLAQHITRGRLALCGGLACSCELGSLRCSAQQTACDHYAPRHRCLKRRLQGNDADTATTEVSFDLGDARIWLLNTLCLQETFFGPGLAPPESLSPSSRACSRVSHVLPHRGLTRTPGDLQPAVPAFFLWLSTRLCNVRVLNVECIAMPLRARDWDPGCRWVWPAWARLAAPPPPPADKAAPLCAVRLVAHMASIPINAESWLSSVAMHYQHLTALCLEGFVVRVLPVMPQLQVLIYGHGSRLLKRDLLGSVACQRRLVSLHLLGRWPETVDSAPVLRLQDLAHLMFVRLDLKCLENSSCLGDIALPERCFWDLVVIKPQFDKWSPLMFPSLTSLCIKWRECDHVMAQPTYVLAALKDSPKIGRTLCNLGALR